MARLEAEEAAREPAPWVTAMRWLAPAVGAGLAALVLTVLVPADESPISTDALLLANAADTGAVERLFVHDAPSADEMLGFTLDQPMEQQ
jgi:hypothetical protein